MYDNRRFLIFTGGNLGKWAFEQIRDGDFLIGADSGALFLLQNGRQPDIALGDFDSLTPGQFEYIRRECRELISCDPVYKDYTDTEMAFDWAVSQKPSEIIMLGATGSRFDHTLANVHLLYKGACKGIPCRIIDENNEMTVTDRLYRITKGPYTHVSLLPLTPKVTGINLTGFQYPLTDAVLEMGTSLAISNILVSDTEPGVISVESGVLLVIKSRD